MNRRQHIPYAIVAIGSGEKGLLGARQGTIANVPVLLASTRRLSSRLHSLRTAHGDAPAYKDLVKTCLGKLLGCKVCVLIGITAHQNDRPKRGAFDAVRLMIALKLQ